MSKDRFAWLIELGCIACHLDGISNSPSEIHHLKGHEFSGMGMRANNENTIPLCYQHHRGQYGYHHSPKAFTARYGTQRELLDLTNDIIKRMGYVRNTSNT